MYIYLHFTFTYFTKIFLYLITQYSKLLELDVKVAVVNYFKRNSLSKIENEILFYSKCQIVLVDLCN